MVHLGVQHRSAKAFFKSSSRPSGSKAVLASAPASNWSRRASGIRGSLRRGMGGLLCSHHAQPRTKFLTVPPKFSPQRSSAGFPPARIDMAASKCVHDGRTEITNDESPRSPDKKRDQEKSEPKRDTAPYTWHRPEAAKRQDRKEQGDDRTQCSEKHRIP